MDALSVNLVRLTAGVGYLVCVCYRALLYVPLDMT